VVWTLDTACVVLDVDPRSEDNRIPKIAKNNGLQHALLVSQIQDVVVNARLQRKNATPEMLLRAFLYYYDRDAFIDFNAEPQND